MLRVLARQLLLKRKNVSSVLHRNELHKYTGSTVFALSSGEGKCGVAVVRVTGNEASHVIKNMTLPNTLPKPRTATLRHIIHPNTGEALDRGLVLWFPGPHSFTGEDSCELHIHGGPAVISAVLGALGTFSACVPAQPGDFTKRAFYHGKLDLTRVEGLGDLIHAETEAQRKQALQQMEGALTHLYDKWRQSLLQCRAYLEAYIDFSEDENIQDAVKEEVLDSLKKLVEELEHHLADNRRGERLRSGLRLVILGQPNVGKSSLLNALTQKPTAIVSPIPGTTRDVVETLVDLGGYPVILSDTAGLRMTLDPVESEGVCRALDRAEKADLALIVLDATVVLKTLRSKGSAFKFSEYLKRHLVDLGIVKKIENNEQSPEWISNQSYIVIINKVDLVGEEDTLEMENIVNESCTLMSIKSQKGLDVFINKLTRLCGSLCDIGTAENPTLTQARHRTHLLSCLKTLKLILHPDQESHSSLLHSEETVVVAAHLLYKAATSLGYVTGHITSEHVLDHIFSAFCIGK